MAPDFFQYPDVTLFLPALPQKVPGMDTKKARGGISLARVHYYIYSVSVEKKH